MPQPWIELLLEATDGSQLAEAVARASTGAEGEAGVTLARAAAEAIIARLGPAAIDAAVRHLLDAPAATARFAAAEVLRRIGREEAAAEALDAAIRATALPEPLLLLERIRSDVRHGLWSQAAADLLLALERFPPYTFYLKAERPLDQLLRSGTWHPRRRLRLAVLAGATTSLLLPVLRMSAFRLGLQLDLYEGAFGAWRQEILDAASGLYAFKPEAVCVLLPHEELALEPTGSRDAVQKAVADLRNSWQTLGQRTGCRIVQAGFDLPPVGPWGSLETVLPDGRRRLVTEANLALAADMPPNVSFIDVEAATAEAGVPLRSELDWLRARQYPAPAALPALADAVCGQLAAGFGLAKKVLVLDLDNTLWGGVIGEDGLGGIKIGPPSAEGEGYTALQRYCRQLGQRGVLLAVCSKNNPDDARRPFLEHDAMLLRLEDFAAFHASWDEKPSGLAEIARQLSLGLDSFVFLDDNPVERQWVRQRLPAVTVPEFGCRPWEMLAALRRGRYFEAVALTAEDLARHSAYRSDAARRDLQQEAASVEDFLAGLEMIAQHGPIDETTLARVTQLVNKTNQFNLTTRRRTESQVREMAASADWCCRWFRLGDRFGDHGLIGVMFARAAAEDRATWTIDTWLMSCRVLGRRVEHYMLRTLVESLCAIGARRIVGEYLPTGKNGLVEGLYAQMGFRPQPDAAGEFSADLSDGYAAPECPWIKSSRGQSS